MLEWFFTKGMCWFGSSKFGGSLERASLFAGDWMKCGRCKGTGWVKTKIRVCEHCSDGYGDQDPPLPCRHCGGRRVIEVETNSPMKGFDAVDICQDCGGTCVSPREKRRRRAHGGDMKVSEQHDYHVQQFDFFELKIYGIVTRHLQRLTDQQVAVLYAYWGVGAAYVSKRKFGRYWPVVPLTPQGRNLIRRFRWARPKRLMPAVERWDPEFEFMKTWADLTQPEILEELQALPENHIRGSTWKKAREGAVELVKDAGLAWRAVSLGEMKTAERPRTAERRSKGVVVERPRRFFTRKLILEEQTCPAKTYLSDDRGTRA